MRNLIATALVAAGGLLAWSGTPVAAADSPCATLGGDVEGEQTCHWEASTSSYTLDMRFPLDYADQQALTDYISQNRDGFVSVAQTSSQTSGTRDVPFQMEVTFQEYHSGQPPGGTQSVVIKVFEDLGGAPPVHFLQGFQLRPRITPSRSPSTRFLRPNSKPLDSIFPIVQREVGRQTGFGAAILPGSGLDSSHYQNFGITDDELIFYFAPGELLPPTIAGASSSPCGAQRHPAADRQGLDGTRLSQPSHVSRQPLAAPACNLPTSERQINGRRVCRSEAGTTRTVTPRDPCDCCVRSA